MEQIIFEILPPPATWEDERVDKWSSDVCEMLKRENFSLVTLPEIVYETHEGSERSIAYIPKFDNLHFASILTEQISSLEIIPNKISVRLTRNQFESWVEHIYNKGIRHLVLVGGEHSAQSYPGYNVIDATRYVKGKFPDMKVGGITIFTRKGEARRIVEKMKAGMDFFFSQIILEASNMKVVMLKLNKLCKEENLPFPEVYLSLALATKIKDIEFMRWLGVEFPTAIHSYLTESEDNIEERSEEVVDMLLDEIFSFKERENIKIGFIIEHVMYNNLYLSEKLFNDVRKRLTKEAELAVDVVN